MKIEVLHAGGCAMCQRDLPTLRAVAQALDPGVEWLELDIMRAIDYAVELGVMKPPAVAIDGELVFSALPTQDALAAAIQVRLEGRGGH